MTAADTLREPVVRLDSFSAGSNVRSFSFCGLHSVVSAFHPHDVVPAMQKIEQEVSGGLHAAGFISYEAGAAFNPDLPLSQPGSLPLLWFALFHERHEVSHPRTTVAEGEQTITPPAINITQKQYITAIESIRNAIARGETYQVNFTARQIFSFSGDPFALYRRICHNQKASYCAYIDTGKHQIVSASPELFFSLKDRRITMNPMKGTAPRHPRSDLDRHQKEELARCEKNRAENLMIVDLIRNDLSQIAETGTVQVESLFDIETFPTVHQMTSKVTARIRPETGLTDIFRALFPCGSVTGAPKRRTMEIINRLEDTPRGVYCGAIGNLSPGGEAMFSVAIRTAVINSADGTGELGIGSGITWDSDPLREFEECLIKGEFLTRNVDEFKLIESLRHDDAGYFLLERHVKRLADSAHYFAFTCNADAITAALAVYAKNLHGVNKVRLFLAEDGTFRIDSEVIAEQVSGTTPLITVSDETMDPADTFLYHKTTRRTRYENELRSHPECYDVVFLNTRGELTEGCFNTLVVSRQGQLFTPALECGLLPGVMREELLEAGVISEAILTLSDLQNADAIWLVNSVRGWRTCRYSMKTG